MKDISGKDMIDIITLAGGEVNYITTDNIVATIEDEYGYLLKFRKMKGKVVVTMKKFNKKILVDEKVEVGEEEFDSCLMLKQFIEKTNEEGYTQPEAKQPTRKTLAKA